MTWHREMCDCGHQAFVVDVTKDTKAVNLICCNCRKEKLINF